MPSTMPVGLRMQSEVVASTEGAQGGERNYFWPRYRQGRGA